MSCVMRFDVLICSIAVEAMSGELFRSDEPDLKRYTKEVEHYAGELVKLCCTYGDATV